MEQIFVAPNSQKLKDVITSLNSLTDAKIRKPCQLMPARFANFAVLRSPAGPRSVDLRNARASSG